MSPERDAGKDLALATLGSGGDGRTVKGAGNGATRPAPAEASPKKPAPSPTPVRPDPASPISSPPRPPNRPLPPEPTARPSGVRNVPQSSRMRPALPQAPLAMNPPTRPGTAATQPTGTATPLTFLGSSKRLSWTSTSSRRPIKYGRGKHSRTELVPQPSDDPDDPLNWPVWRKELNFWSLQLMVAMTGVAKTIFMTVNAQLAESFQVSYTAVAALTGIPLLLSALTGLLCLTASRICGKRPLYLGSLSLLFIGVVWNSNVAGSFAQCMAARVFQGLGWGAFDTLILGSIQDTFFEHERGRRMTIHSVAAVATTWGPPLIGGVASQGSAGFSLQFTVLSAFFAVAVPAVALGAPETTFDRTFALAQTPATAASQFKTLLPPTPRRLFSLETVNEYVVKLKPYAYRGPADLTVLLQVPRALVTPTTALLALVSMLPAFSLWGLATSLSLLFHPLPFFLPAGSVGALFTGPSLLPTLAVAAAAALPTLARRLGRRIPFAAAARRQQIHTLALLATGTLLVFVGILTFGLHLDAAMTLPTTAAGISPFAPDYLPARASLPALSFVLGLLAAGAALLDASLAPPLVRASAAFTGSSLAAATRSTADMAGALAAWRALAAGVAALAVPNAVWAWDGLRAFCVGVAAAQVGVAAAVGAVWWRWGQAVRRGDGRVMGLVDLDGLKETGSFFDTD